MSLEIEIELDRAFLSLVSDPSSKISVGTSGSIGGGGSRSDTLTLDGSFRNYANGETRLILAATQNRVEVLTLRALLPSDVKWLIGAVGKTVLFRDTYGRKMWGAFLSPSFTDIPLSGQAKSADTLQTDAAITFVQTTFVEGE